MDTLEDKILLNIASGKITFEETSDGFGCSIDNRVYDELIATYSLDEVTNTLNNIISETLKWYLERMENGESDD